jgi:hypothetical protein
MVSDPDGAALDAAAPRMPAPAGPAPGASRPDPSTIRLRWAAACTALLLLVVASLQARGHGARVPFDASRELGGRPWASVGDAGDAVRVWMASGLRGRRLLVLTGRWSRPRTLENAPVSEADLARGLSLSAAPLDLLDADAALWTAGTRGIARSLDVVMPPAAFARRRAEVAGKHGFRPRAGGFALPFDAYERAFWTPDGYRPEEESVLVLIEPSFFEPGAPPDVARWLRRLGVRFDLALVTLEDPVATEDQRAEARRLVADVEAPFVEVPR